MCVFTDAAILQRAPLSSATPRVGVGPGITADLGPVTIELDLGLAVVRNESDRLRLLSFRIGSRF